MVNAGVVVDVKNVALRGAAEKRSLSCYEAASMALETGNDAGLNGVVGAGVGASVGASVVVGADASSESRKDLFAEDFGFEDELVDPI